MHGLVHNICYRSRIKVLKHLRMLSPLSNTTMKPVNSYQYVSIICCWKQRGIRSRSISCLWCSRHLQPYFSYIVAVTFIDGGNRSIRRKPPTCRKSLTNFIITVVSSTPRHERGSNSNFSGDGHWLHRYLLKMESYSFIIFNSLNCRRRNHSSL